MDYAATDKYMSGWVISCVKGTTRFFLREDGLPTDILAHASWYRWEDDAREDATTSRNEWLRTGQGKFDWQPMRVAEVMANVDWS